MKKLFTKKTFITVAVILIVSAIAIPSYLAVTANARADIKISEATENATLLAIQNAVRVRYGDFTIEDIKKADDFRVVYGTQDGKAYAILYIDGLITLPVQVADIPATTTP